MNKEINYDDFKARELSEERIQQIIDTSESTTISTGEHFSDGSRQELSVVALEPAKDVVNDTIVILTHQWSAENHEDSRYVAAAVTEATGSRVLLVNTPGVQSDGGSAEKREGRLTIEQEEELRLGSFRGVGAASLEAAMGMAKIQKWEAGNVVIVGSSQGASLAAGMIGSAMEKNMPVKVAALDEIVNLSDRSVIGLAANFTKANGPMGEYLKRNPNIVNEHREPALRAMGRLAGNIVTNGKYGKALSKDRFLLDLADNYTELVNKIKAGEKIKPDDYEFKKLRERKIIIGLGRAAYSEVTLEEPTRDTVNILRKNEVDVRYTEHVGHTHAYTTTVEARAQTIDNANKVIDSSAS